MSALGFGKDVARTLRELREIADAMPPGPQRDAMQLDLRNLRGRLASLPGRIAAQAANQPKEIIEQVLDRELRFAFCDVFNWRILK